MDYLSGDDGRGHGFSSANSSKCRSVDRGASLNARELERKLGALGLGRRRQYYSNLACSGALPAPMREVDEISKEDQSPHRRHGVLFHGDNMKKWPMGVLGRASPRGIAYGRKRNHHQRTSPLQTDINAPGQHIDETIAEDTSDEEWGGHGISNYYRLPPNVSPASSTGSPLTGKRAAGFMSSYCRVGAHPPSPNEEPDSSPQFQFAELSGWTAAALEQGKDADAETSESESAGRSTNYEKFKRWQMSRRVLDKLSRQWSSPSKLGADDSVKSDRAALLQNTSLPSHRSYHSTPEHHHHHRHIQGLNSRSQVPASVKSPSHQKRSVGASSNGANRGATLNAARKKANDPSFHGLSASMAHLTDEGHRRMLDSLAVIKCSSDPKQDFKESMVEMICGKGLNSSCDLVELVQCYLTLNPRRHHDTIVKVFTEIWCEMVQEF